jgi:TonB family protein
MLWAGIAQRGQAAEDIRQLTEIWRRHVAARPESARVLSNAAAVMMRAGMLFDAESLLQRARRLEPSEPSSTAFLANLYANTILGNQSGSEEFLPKVRAELASTPDPLLLAYVAEQLLAYSGPPRPASGGKSLSAQLAEQRVQEAEKYLRRALLLDPENEAAKKVMAIYESRLKQTTDQPGAAPRRITVGRNVQNALLLHKPEPVYPEAARRAGVQGKVVFRAVIGCDGEIKQLQIVSGHPSLVEAARDAAMKYRYRPTLLNGEPVEVETEIEVPFGLPATAPPQAEARRLQDTLREGGTTAPQPVVRVPLEMTPEARAARAQGAVLLEILIDEEGNVKEAQVRRGFGLGMDEKAVETVLQWKFQPALKDGKPVPVRANVEMKFQAM